MSGPQIVQVELSLLSFQLFTVSETTHFRNIPYKLDNQKYSTTRNTVSGRMIKLALNLLYRYIKFAHIAYSLAVRQR